MHNHKISLEIKKEERLYQFFCFHDAPLGEVFDVLAEMRNYVVARINEHSQEEVKKETKPEQV